MAAQLHVAFSETVEGAAIIAGGPYYCAEGNLSLALARCTQGDDIPVAELLTFTSQAAADGRIDAPENLADDRVWLFHGANDTLVAEGVTDALSAYYSRLTHAGSITYITDIPAAHGFPTDSDGAPCDRMESPFLNACGFDAAGELLQHLYGALEPPDDNPVRPPIEFSQAEFGNSLDESGYAYVPEACAAGRPCRLHVAFHGCRQGAEFVGEEFVRNAGYNRWAEANDIIVVYPQVRSSVFGPVNPHGCWDWWGYTGNEYMTQDGEQLRAIMQIIAYMSNAGGA